MGSLVRVQSKTLLNYNRYFKLYIKCILKNATYFFVENHTQQSLKNVSILLGSKYLYFTCSHLKFSSVLYLSQLTDIFAYEVPRRTINKFTSGSVNKLTNLSSVGKSLASIIVYNFHLLGTQERFYIFVSNTLSTQSLKAVSSFSVKIVSITELFFAANWLERELSELHGVIIKNKKDLRNLMLQYGDSSSPFQKSFPSIGLKEMYYNPIKDTIVQSPLSVQF